MIASYHCPNNRKRNTVNFDISIFFPKRYTEKNHLRIHKNSLQPTEFARYIPGNFRIKQTSKCGNENNRKWKNERMFCEKAKYLILFCCKQYNKNNDNNLTDNRKKWEYLIYYWNKIYKIIEIGGVNILSFRKVALAILRRLGESYQKIPKWDSFQYFYLYRF